MLSVCHPKILHNHCFQFLGAKLAGFNPYKKLFANLETEANWNQVRSTTISGIITGSALVNIRRKALSPLMIFTRGRTVFYFYITLR